MTATENVTLTQPALVSIPILQALTIGTYAQPDMATVPIQPVATTSGQPQQSQKFGALCTPIERQCLNNYQLPIHPEWSDPEEKDLGKQKNRKNERKEIWMVPSRNKKDKNFKMTKFQNQTQKLCPF